MPVKRHPKCLALALALAGLAVAAPLAAGAAFAQGDVIAERKAGLKRMGGHTGSIKDILDAKGDLTPVAAQARDMEGFFKRLPALFPQGSDKGDTKARAEIWSDRAGFEAASAKAAAASAQLVSAASAKDAGATATAFRELGGSCGACHRSYRAR